MLLFNVTRNRPAVERVSNAFVPVATNSYQALVGIDCLVIFDTLFSCIALNHHTDSPASSSQQAIAKVHES